MRVTFLVQAIRQKGNEKSIFDSRAAVFEKLDRTADALRDSKMVIDLVPSSWQVRCASTHLIKIVHLTF